MNDNVLVRPKHATDKMLEYLNGFYRQFGENVQDAAPYLKDACLEWDEQITLLQAEKVLNYWLNLQELKWNIKREQVNIQTIERIQEAIKALKDNTFSNVSKQAKQKNSRDYVYNLGKLKGMAMVEDIINAHTKLHLEETTCSNQQ